MNKRDYYGPRQSKANLISKMNEMVKCCFRKSPTNQNWKILNSLKTGFDHYLRGDNVFHKKYGVAVKKYSR